jgi:hypothetical protein
MKWFKHISKSRYDAKMMRIIRKHGLRGYGLYFAVLEGIAFDLEPDKPIPELEETDHDIAAFFGEDTLKIEEIVNDFVSEGLFTINPSNKRIMCLKLLAYLDNTLSQNPQIKEILSNFKLLEADSLKQIRLDETRLDEIKSKDNKEHSKKNDVFIKPSIDEVKEYIKQKEYKVDADTWYLHYESNGWLVGKVKMRSWKASISYWSKNSFNNGKSSAAAPKKNYVEIGGVKDVGF